ncbi:HipA domain-containing protein [Baekduia sp.]|jgi:serine/threonine-protein kinase HipA|uniref:HipA domain-containing protein n=1 Tax=Baekduia sp. TaxID=2600305 RepID=UPI002DFD4FDE|nr:HipA domain-containing protein [Baekduia sp.]
MAARSRTLGVWLDGLRIADLEQRRRPEIRCRYTELALDTWQLNSPLISCSLPLSVRPQDARAFCIGLLPEGQALQALAARAGVATNDSFALLARYGRDVAGALVISEEEPEAQRFAVETYSADTLVAAVSDLDDHPLGVDDDSELSLAGLQDKLLLVAQPDGGWARPLHGRPSTHILKRDDLRFPGLVAAEAQCLALARALGLTTIESELVALGETDCLIVSRFDRQEIRSGTVRRIHQEDLCQAVGIDPDQQGGRAKYERAGGPGLRDITRLLDTWAVDARAELDTLVRAVTYTVLIGNADAHGKNLALLHPTPETVMLAPLYDTVPTVLWSRLRSEAAMAIGGQKSLPAVTLDDIVAEARRWSHPADRARHVATTAVTAAVAALDDGVMTSDTRLADTIRARAAELLVA